ncbi:sigma-70 family RNA polymerase sigma factor [Actinomycetospora sp. TBRC 11914]|uniref:sigma-70 family RNA polymerase sigma factor n=1 Tax=Actinomycetospora sp. TBRC 11914 TaxID=2729387 RepID=UPI00145F6037|nr:sigma-70 family RNA polymerase sigma factor [Actinomycetospora sp. TBRC 11914]NMO92656.1 sigma-70 family RNA polymerase sigma factor [Actinomycetospora sp. TBRC 11914]
MDDAVITAAALAARDGDRAAAARFVELTQQQVWRLLAHLADRGSAADLAQETYERAFGALRRYRAESPARTWLLAIARHVAADHLRRRARRPVAPAPVADADEPVGVVRSGDVAEGIALRLAVDALTADRREAFVLTQLLGLGYAEAAEVLGCPVGTIRSRVARARADLVDALEQPSAGEAATREP